MVSEEDRIKIPIYKDFQEKYFSERTDRKKRFIQLNPQEKLEFCHQQKIYVEEEYQKVKYNLKTKTPKTPKTLK